jgi:hypothetical protein
MTESATVTTRMLYVAACLVLPVVWGVLVNWLFTAWRQRPTAPRPPEAPDESVFPDYQI